MKITVSCAVMALLMMTGEAAAVQISQVADPKNQDPSAASKQYVPPSMKDVLKKPVAKPAPAKPAPAKPVAKPAPKPAKKPSYDDDLSQVAAISHQKDLNQTATTAAQTTEAASKDSKPEITPSKQASVQLEQGKESELLGVDEKI